MNLIPLLCEHIVRAIHAPVFEYDEHGTILHCYGAPENSESVPVQMPPAAYSGGSHPLNSPLLFFESESILYGTIQTPENSYIVCGPVSVRYRDGKPGQKVTYCPLELFAEELALLSNVIHNTKLTSEDIFRLNTDLQLQQYKINQATANSLFQLQENTQLHNSYQRELRERRSIAEGDMESLQRSINETFTGKYGTLAKDELRSHKNLAIVMTTIASRAAIEGGIQPETAFSVSDAVIRLIEDSTNSAQANAICRQAEYNFCSMVADHKYPGKRDPLINHCIELVHKNLHRKINVSELALELSVTPDYLSSRFKKIQGISLVDFILNEKVQQAENLLIYSKYTLEEIAFHLGFSSQSHFGAVFKKLKKITPRAYREQFGYREPTS